MTLFKGPFVSATATAAGATAAAVLASAPALAHDGFHAHPHGLSAGWVAAALLGLVAGYGLTLLRGRA